MKINWKRKLSSRKFWLAVVGFVTPLIAAFGISEAKADSIAAIIMSGATVITYIVGEGMVDMGRNTDNYENKEE